MHARLGVCMPRMRPLVAWFSVRDLLCLSRHPHLTTGLQPYCTPPIPQVLVRRYRCPRDSLVLLYRHSPEELDKMVAQAVERVEGAADAVAAAKQRRQRVEAARVRATAAGAGMAVTGRALAGAVSPACHRLRPPCRTLNTAG